MLCPCHFIRLSSFIQAPLTFPAIFCFLFIPAFFPPLLYFLSHPRWLLSAPQWFLQDLGCDTKMWYQDLSWATRLFVSLVFMNKVPKNICRQVFVWKYVFTVCFLYAFYIIVVVLVYICVCMFFGCFEYTCHEGTAHTQDHFADSYDSLHLWTHISCYIFVLPTFSPIHVFYLHHFLIPYCIFIVHVCTWVCMHAHRCVHQRTTCRSQFSLSVIRTGKPGSKSCYLLGRLVDRLHFTLLSFEEQTFLAKHFTQSDCCMYWWSGDVFSFGK